MFIVPSILIAGREVLFDEKDERHIAGKEWTVRESRNTCYVQRCQYLNGEYVGYESLHRLIAGCEDGQLVDHINGNGLDNRRSNLRLCSHVENMQNRRMHRNNQSGHKGVYFDPDLNGRPWRAQIRAHGKKHCLGRFDTAEQACEAYKNAALRLHGPFARTA